MKNKSAYKPREIMNMLEEVDYFYLSFSRAESIVHESSRGKPIENLEEIKRDRDHLQVSYSRYKHSVPGNIRAQYTRRGILPNEENFTKLLGKLEGIIKKQESKNDR